MMLGLNYLNQCLFLLVMLFSVSVVCVKQNTRLALAQLNQLTSIKTQYYNERTQLLLEQSAWMTYGRIDKMARDKLGMVLPSKRQWVVIKP